MGLPNDSILVTPGTGATVATHTISGKKYQVTMEADSLGHIKGSRADFLTFFTPATNAVNRRVGDLFNADASLVVRVQGIWLVPTVTAITGANIQFKLSRTNSVGTGGTVITSRPMDTAYAALDADITARAGATGGAAVVYDYMFMYQFNEETNSSTQILQYYNLMPIVSDKSVEVVLRQNEGLLITQTAGATVGLTGALMYFTVE